MREFLESSRGLGCSRQQGAGQGLPEAPPTPGFQKEPKEQQLWRCSRRGELMGRSREQGLGSASSKLLGWLYRDALHNLLTQRGARTQTLRSRVTCPNERPARRPLGPAPQTQSLPPTHPHIPTPPVGFPFQSSCCCHQRWRQAISDPGLLGNWQEIPSVTPSEYLQTPHWLCTQLLPGLVQ